MRTRSTIKRSLATLGVLALATTPAAFGQGAYASPHPTVAQAAAAAPLTVAQAIGTQTSAVQPVRGYIVGQPTATTTVVRSGFPNDYAIALADSPSETSTAKMLYVQLPSALRAAWGLKSHPGNLGKQVDATGALSAYFSHPGMKDASSIAATGSTDPGDPGDPPPSDPGSYYDGTGGLSGAALKAKLHEIISKQTVLSYDGVWDALKDTDQDPNNSNNVIEVYSGTSTPKSNNGGGVDNWNREHVWAKSHGDFGTTPGPGTDVHHLRPEDVSVNADRGNLDFDNGGGAVDQCPGCASDSDSWQPRDAVKGDVARMIFYMAVRYDGTDAFADLEVNDKVNNGTAPNIGKVSVLKQWSQEDPPDAFEQRRNEVIFTTWQHNRNPFIDHPEWVASIF
ncbi:endonuclease [Luteipulveratus mongoliensis]|uniref:Ribonuclease n=1 Tax=Luteipulveratus mongoliensis TaxID=571913 RepID=A0A0K1JMH9_9MICO|nr:endonuclease [Luteipulveratus mongoliensis]AKU17780.1 ribonuclease [Luteipulveratus mongoliensis]